MADENEGWLEAYERAMAEAKDALRADFAAACDACGAWRDDDFCETCYAAAFAAIRTLADSLPRAEMNNRNALDV
jgi:hypothetical protein